MKAIIYNEKTHKLVPVETTLEMCEAFHRAHDRYENGGGEAPTDHWNGMLAVAPEAESVPGIFTSWPLTTAELRELGVELIAAADAMGGEQHDCELVLSAVSAGVSVDDDGNVNDHPILTVMLAEYPEEGAYPIDPDNVEVPAWARNDYSQAVQSVLAERFRQIHEEGNTPERDDQYNNSELERAAGCYMLFSDAYPNAGQPPPQWPWHPDWWKPKDYRRDMVRAVALGLAAIEKNDRARGNATGEARRDGQ